MLDPTAFYRDLLGPEGAAIQPITGVVVRESASSSRHATRRRVIFLATQAGNARHGNRYTEQAVRALVQEIKRHPKIYMGHTSPASIHAGTERHVGDMVGVAVRETVHYDPTLKAVVGEIECTPHALNLIDLAHSAGDTIGVSIEAVGEPATFGSHDIVGWRNYRGACLVPEGGAGVLTVREAASGAPHDDGFGQETTMTDSTAFLRDLFAPLAQAAARAAAVRETAASDGPWDALVRETSAGLRAYYPQLTPGAASLITRRAKETWDPNSLVTWEEVVACEASDYVDTLPEPLGREGSVRYFDAFIEARGGR